MEFQLSRAVLRAWRLEDAESLAGHLNRRAMWRNLAFPYPYTVEDALQHIRGRIERPAEPQWAIEVAGQPAGSIWLQRGDGVYQRSAEIGYWVAEAHHGQGSATEAAQVVTAYGLDELGLVRIFARVFEWNPASIRVLEKVGFQLEGRHRRAVIIDDQTTDQVMYAVVREG